MDCNDVMMMVVNALSDHHDHKIFILIHLMNRCDDEEECAFPSPPHGRSSEIPGGGGGVS